jgi:transcriptional regulator with XRE-family HTH domain
MTLPKELRQLGKGWSLRRIAAVTGISHEQVRRIVNG